MSTMLLGLHRQHSILCLARGNPDANANGLAETNERVLVEHEAINIDTSWQFMFISMNLGTQKAMQ